MDRTGSSNDIVTTMVIIVAFDAVMDLDVTFDLESIVGRCDIDKQEHIRETVL